MHELFGPLDGHTLRIQLTAGLGIIMLAMGGVWLLSRRIHNAGIVDVAWSASFTILSSLYAWLGTGWLPRRVAVAVIASCWSLRLTLHLWQRVRRLHPAEDSRYEELRKRWAPNVEWKFLIFFEAQAVLSVMLSVPYALVTLNGRRSFGTLELAGALLWLIAFAGEAVADRQLDRFKNDPANHGRTMDLGLWRYSRHPNYFFEWMIGVAWFVIAAGSPWGLVTIYCPLLMLHFLLNVTGVPMAEEQSLKSRGDEYRRYQRVTSRFIPMPSKEPR